MEERDNQISVEELLPYFGIEGQVISYGSTELVHLDRKSTRSFYDMRNDSVLLGFMRE